MQGGGSYIRVDLEEVKPQDQSVTSEEKERKLLPHERKKIRTTIEHQFKAVISITPPTSDSLAEFDRLLADDQLKQLERLMTELELKNTPNRILEPKSFLHNARLQPLLVQMLEDIAQYRAYLERFIIRFGAENEYTAPKQNPQSVKKKLITRIYYALCQLVRCFSDCLQTNLNRVVNMRNNQHEIHLGNDSKQSDTTANKKTQSKSDTFIPSAPIHYAVLQLNGDFLDWLLARDNTDVNLTNNCKQTALTMLCQKYDQCMRKSIQACPPDEKQKTLGEIRTLIKQLLEKGADFNICSIYMKLPFELLLQHCVHDETRSFVKQCLQVTRRALAICRINERNERVVGFYNNNPNVCVTVELLEIFLRYNDCSNFAKYLAHFEVNEANVKKVIRLLLHTACDQKLSECLRLVLDRGEKHIFKVTQRKPTRVAAEQVQKGSELEHRVELKGLLKKVCLMADLPLLRRLLAKISDLIVLNDDPLLGLTLTKAYNCNHRIEERNALLACAEYLLNHKLIYKTKQDNYGNTPLHLAFNYGFDSIAQVLLTKRYTYLGTCNKNNQTPLDCAKYEFWRKYLDQSIVAETKGSQRIEEIWFNLNGFSPPLKYNSDGTISSRSPRGQHRSWKFIQPVNETFTQPQTFTSTVTEMTALRQIAQSNELKRLLLHPVLYTFIMVKWTRLCHWNYLNLLLTALTIVFFGYYSLTACSAEGPSTLLLILSIFGVVFVVIRELLQFLFLRRSYISFENVLDIIRAIAMAVALVIGCHGLLSSFVIIHFIIELLYLLGSLQSNSLATIIHMFGTVSKNFLKSFLLFMPLIGTFIYAFHLTYNQSPDQVCVKDDCAQDSFNNFRTFWNATVKTLVMTTGEFDAASINFEGGKMLLFILFMFYAPIVILNLINGLAVSDIAAIREESELISISKKVLLLEQYERGVANVYPAWLKRFFPKPFFSEYQSRIHVKTKEYCKIVVHTKGNPNQPKKDAPGSKAPPNNAQSAVKSQQHKSSESPDSKTSEENSTKRLPKQPTKGASGSKDPPNSGQGDVESQQHESSESFGSKTPEENSTKRHPKQPTKDASESKAPSNSGQGDVESQQHESSESFGSKTPEENSTKRHPKQPTKDASESKAPSNSGQGDVESQQHESSESFGSKTPEENSTKRHPKQPTKDASESKAPSNSGQGDVESQQHESSESFGSKTPEENSTKRLPKQPTKGASGSKDPPNSGQGDVESQQHESSESFGSKTPEENSTKRHPKQPTKDASESKAPSNSGQGDVESQQHESSESFGSKTPEENSTKRLPKQPTKGASGSKDPPNSGQGDVESQQHESSKSFGSKTPEENSTKRHPKQPTKDASESKAPSNSGQGDVESQQHESSESFGSKTPEENSTKRLPKQPTKGASGSKDPPNSGQGDVESQQHESSESFGSKTPEENSTKRHPKQPTKDASESKAPSNSGQGDVESQQYESSESTSSKTPKENSTKRLPKQPTKGASGSKAPSNSSQDAVENQQPEPSQSPNSTTPKENSTKRKAQKRLFSKFPWLLSSKSCNYLIDVHFYRFALFVRLDQSMVDKALAIIEKQHSNYTYQAAPCNPR
ncbi:uncharacterized protein LOC125771575 isoform X6 [Anopheles funestus]|uniref:uncharacterized protein LOC125771575 isoform X6 n=1 Tax=Anopheles funestus TaxID=62324 RepID=UPI0020C68951|nr:uncharacterized protein LOC125771575 isoform X6 [Anopheles funestus]